MKILKFILFVFISLLLLNGRTFAQGAGFSIVAITYSTREDIDFLFENTTQVLEYLEGEDIESPTFLSLVSNEQIEIIENNGYELKILEENADISRFTLLYNPISDQADRLSSLGEPIVVSSHYTLLKMPEGVEFTHEGVGGEFFDIPFSEIISPPPLRTKTATELSITPSPMPSQGNSFPLVIGIIGVIVLIVIIGIIVIAKRRSQVENY